jgi:hypothetical protein
MTFFDRACLNESLDVLLDRENGKGDEKTAEEDAAEEDRLDREAERGALRGFDDGDD